MVQYAQKECYDCLGMFPGNQMVRISETRETGSSYQVEDTFDASKHRIHRREKDLLICRGCLWRRRRKLAIWIGLLLAAISGLILYLYNLPPPIGKLHMDDVASLEGNGANQNMPVSELSARTGKDDEWKEQRKVDLMSDMETFSVSRHFPGKLTRILGIIGCVRKEKLYYQFKTFDAQGAPVSMLGEPDLAIAVLAKNGLAGMGPVIKYAARADDQPAKTGYVLNPKYPHVFTISAGLTGVKASDLGNATIIHVRLPLQTGDETIEIDQTDPAVSRVLTECGFGQTTLANESAKDADLFAEVPTTRAAISPALIDMGYESDSLKPGNVVLDTFDFSTVGSSVQVEWLGKILSRNDQGISVGLKLAQPQMWYYAVVHHGCKSSTDFRWEKFWNADPDAVEGEVAIGAGAAKRAKQESADDIGPLIYAALCPRP